MTVTHLKTKVILGLLFFVVFILQITPAISNSVYFGFDQGLDQLLVHNFVSNHKISFVGRYSGLQGVLMGPVWTLLNSIPYVLGGGDPGANVIFWSVISIFSTLLFVLLMNRKYRFNYWPVLIIFIFSSVFIDSARIVTSPNPLVFISPLFIYFLYDFRDTKREVDLIYSWFLLGLFFQLEIAFAVYALLLLLIVIVRYGGLKQVFTKSNIIGVAIFLVLLAPQMIFDFRHDFIMSKGLLGFFFHQNNSLMISNNPFIERIFSRFVSLLQDISIFALFPNNLILSAILIITALIGWHMVSRYQPKLRQLLSFLLIIIVVFYVGFIFYPGPLWQWYRAGLPIVFVMLVGLPLGFLWQHNLLGKIVSLIFCTLFIIQTLIRFDFPLSLSKSHGDYVGNLGEQKRVVDYIYQQSEGKSFRYYVYTPPVYDYIWQYNFAWYGQKTYSKLPINYSLSIPLLGIGEQARPPAKGENGDIFLIIEPNLERPGEISYWKEHFISVGEFVSSKTFPSGIVIEHRR